jgi:hypothetical protein
VTQARRTAERRRRLLTGAFSAAIHVAAIAALLFIHSDVQPPADVQLIPVTLVAPPEPPKPPEPKAPTEKPPQPVKPPPPSLHARPPRTPPPPDVEPLPAAKGPTAIGPVTLSDAETAGASTAENGGGGGGAGCNMTRWLQTQLRKDPLVQTAMAETRSSRPLLVWNGAWVRHGEQEGAGLATVREAIMWEVGFAPIACRSEPVHGYVLISLNDGPGAARLAMGAGDWRWSDLLSAHRR